MAVCSPPVARAGRVRSRVGTRVGRLAAVALGALLLSLVATAAPVAVAGAQDDPIDPASMPVTWAVRPGSGSGEADRPNFVVEGAPGDTVSDVLVVDNTSAVNLVLGVYASDAFNTPEGGTDLLSADRDPVDVGSWVTAEQRSITVPAGGTLEVPFTVEIPEDAEPGDHTGGIVTSLTLSEPDAQGNRIQVERRLGSRIYVRVEGGVEPALTFTNLEVVHHGSRNPFAAGSLTITYVVENTGNVRLRATRLVRVSPTIGSDVTVEAADMPELLPGNSYEFTQDVPNVWPGLATDVEVELDPYESTGATLDPAPSPVVARTALTLWPVSQVVGLLVLVLVVGAVLWRRGSNRSSTPEVAPSAPNPATSPVFPPPLSPDQLGSAGGQHHQGDAP